MPLAEAQSHLIGHYLLGRYNLPARAEMEKDIRQERETVRKRFGNSPRHTIEVDFDPYLELLKKETEAGKKRPGSGQPLINPTAKLTTLAGASGN